MSAYGTKKGKRYLHRCQTGRQAGRQPRHKAARTKELRRCTIRARDGRMRIEGDRGIQRRPTFYEGAGGTAGKVYQGTKDGRKEGRSYTATRHGVRGWKRERWRFLFKRHQRACRKFSPAPAPPAPLSCPRNHTRPCSIHPHTRVPDRSSRVPGGSLGHRRMVNVGSRNAGTATAILAKRVNVVGWHDGFWRMREG